MRKQKNVWAFLLVSLFVFIISAAEILPAYAKQEFNINLNIDNGFISLHCNDATIEDIFLLISKKSNLEFKVYPDMKKKIVTANFKNLGIEKALEQLVRGNYSIVYGSSSQIQKIYILNRGISDNKYELIDSFYKGNFPEINSLKDAVITNVVKEHENAQLYEILPHYDFSGQLTSYSFTFYVGNGSMPDKEVLMNQVTDAWFEKKSAIQQIAEGYKLRDSAIILDAHEISKNASSRISQEDRFVSLEIGADYSIPPIIASWNGLPLDISQYPRALDTINEQLSDKKPVFKRVFTAGFGSIIFEFNTAEHTYYVETDNWRIIHSIELKEPSLVRKDDGSNKLKWASFLDI